MIACRVRFLTPEVTAILYGNWHCPSWNNYVPLRTMQILLRLLRPHLPVLALGLVLGLVSNAANLAAPLATKRIIDTLGTGDALAGPITLLLVLVVIGAVIGLWQWILMGTLAEQVVLDARLSVIQRYFRARLAELTGRPAGELVTRVTADPGLLHAAS